MRLSHTDDCVYRGGLWSLWIYAYFPTTDKREKFCRAVAGKRVDAISRANEIIRKFNEEIQ